MAIPIIQFIEWLNEKAQHGSFGPRFEFARRPAQSNIATAPFILAALPFISARHRHIRDKHSDPNSCVTCACSFFDSPCRTTVRVRRRHIPWMVVAATICVVIGSRAAIGGATSPTTTTAGVESEAVLAAATSADHQLVKVTISTSRTEVTNEGGYGIFADLQNIDTVPLTLRAEDTMLVVQPELGDDHHRIFAVAGFYPTEEKFGDTSKQALRVIVLQPKEHYVAFWDITGRHHEDDVKTDPGWSLAHWLSVTGVSNYIVERLAFVPGNYAFVVVGKTYRTVNGVVEDAYHTYTDQVKLHVGLTQIDAMLAAMLGGILGYLVVSLREGGDFSKYTFLGSDPSRPEGTARGAYAVLKPWLIVGRSLISAALVSAVVTILLSRISDTQFPIKVSVADFWGALTVGFVAFFVGNKVIDRIAGFAAPTPGSASTTPKGPSPSLATDSTGAAANANPD